MYGRGLQLGATAWASGVGLLLLALLTSTAAYQGFDCGQGELKAAHGAFVWHLAAWLPHPACLALPAQPPGNGLILLRYCTVQARRY